MIEGFIKGAGLDLGGKDFYAMVAAGKVPGHSLVQKFGHNTAVGTSYVPISAGGIYQTPQPAGAVALRVKAGGDANDTAAGSGAREITFQGLDETGAQVEESVATAGVSASAATTTTFVRLFRAWVSASGTYATQSAGSMAAAVTIEDSGGVADWTTIPLISFPLSQSEIGAYTIPLGYTGYVLHAHAQSESTKTCELAFFQRQSILDAAAPYQAMRVVFELTLNGGETGEKDPKGAFGPFPALTDIGFMGRLTALPVAFIAVDFEVLLIADGY